MGVQATHCLSESHYPLNKLSDRYNLERIFIPVSAADPRLLPAGFPTKGSGEVGGGMGELPPS